MMFTSSFSALSVVVKVSASVGENLMLHNEIVVYFLLFEPCLKDKQSVMGHDIEY
jgi:hypothetical protein